MPVRKNSLRTDHGHHKMCHCVKLTNMDINGYRVLRYIFGVQGFSSVKVSLAELSMMGFVHHMFSLELSPKHYSDIISVFTLVKVPLQLFVFFFLFSLNTGLYGHEISKRHFSKHLLRLFTNNPFKGFCDNSH